MAFKVGLYGYRLICESCKFITVSKYLPHEGYVCKKCSGDNVWISAIDPNKNWTVAEVRALKLNEIFNT